MANENIVTIKDRKLFYDPYNQAYYFESKIEALERATSNRFKKADALNKNISLTRKSVNRHIDQAEHIFTSKCTREIGELRESLRGHLAYRKVLKQVAKDFELSPKNQPHGKFGTYGPDGYQKEVLPQLEAELNEMNAETRRLKETKRLLRQRKKPEVFGRTFLDDFFVMPKNRKRSKSESNSADLGQIDGDRQPVDFSVRTVLQDSDRDSSADERDKPGKLVLPPIQARMSPTKSKSWPNDNDLSLPSVFVTELEKPEEGEEDALLEETPVEGNMDVLD